jgi:hypothetical protein
MDTSRNVKLEELGLTNYSIWISDGLLDIFYNKYLSMKENIIDYNECSIPEAIFYRVRKTVLLKIVNDMLEISGRDKICRLEEFIDIPKDVIVNDQTKTLFDEMSEEILKYFDKGKCTFYRKNKEAANYQLNMLRGLLQCANYKIQRHAEVIDLKKRQYDNRFTIVKI